MLQGMTAGAGDMGQCFDERGDGGRGDVIEGGSATDRDRAGRF